MDFMEWFGVFLVVVTVVIPVMAITAHLSLRPMVDAILRLRDGLAGSDSAKADDARMAALEAAVVDVRRELRQLRKAEAFHVRLAESKRPPSPVDTDQRPETECMTFRHRKVGFMTPPTAYLLATLTAVAGTFAPLPLQTQEMSPCPALDGTWEGELDAGPAPLLVRLELTRGGGGLSGTFSIPAEGLTELPLASVTAEGDSLVARITPTRVYHGAVDCAEISGMLVMHDQGGREIPMRLFRQDTPEWEVFVAGREAAREAHEAALAAHQPPPLVEATVGPGAARVNPEALGRLVDAASESRSAALVVLIDGEVVGEWYSGGTSRRIEAMSATKSVVSLAVGRLVELGLLESVDVPVQRFFPEWSDGEYRDVTIRHLLNHTSGLESPMPTAPIYASEDFVRFALESPLNASPGTEFTYNNSATNLLAGIIGRAAGQRMDRFLAEELFAPLGIHDFTWSLDAAGNPHGMAGLQIHARDLARLGQLVLQGGEWRGNRLIAEEWIVRSTAPGSGHSDSHGLLWWLVHDNGRLEAVEARGYLGQYLTILPQAGIVAVRMIEGFPGYDQERHGLRDFTALTKALAH